MFMGMSDRDSTEFFQHPQSSGEKGQLCICGVPEARRKGRTRPTTWIVRIGDGQMGVL